MQVNEKEAPFDLLERCSSEEIEPLVEYVVKPLSSRLDKHERFKIHRPNHQKYVDVLCDEIRRYGGHAISNAVRGSGPTYVEIVRDVATKVGVKPKPPEDATIEEIELSILTKLFETAYEKMTDEQQQELVIQIAEQQGNQIHWKAGVPLLLILSQAGIQLSGFVAYQLAVIVANGVARALLGRGLALAANATLARFVGWFAGPVGWVISGLWLTIDLLGPAYRVTIPCVVHIAYLRQKKAHEAAGGREVT